MISQRDLFRRFRKGCGPGSGDILPTLIRQFDHPEVLALLAVPHQWERLSDEWMAWVYYDVTSKCLALMSPAVTLQMGGAGERLRRYHPKNRALRVL
jgi:hypothetical protein